MMAQRTEAQEVPKTQKTFYLEAELEQLIDKVLELSGMNFTKFVTAALLQSLFDRCTHPEIGPVVGPDALWTSFASRIERGDLKVGDIPESLMKDAVYLAKSPLNDPEHHRDGDKAGWLEIQKRLLRDRERALKFWREAVKEKKGEIPAALGSIEECFGR